MKNIKNLIFGGGLLLLFLASCSESELKYDVSVVKGYEIQLNGGPPPFNVGLSTRPIFIYKENGEYLANYNWEFRFALDKGNYKFVATDIPDPMILTPTNLNDLVVRQFPKGDQKVNLSAAMPYASPFEEKLTMNILTRTGTLRLKATDVNADKSYSIIKTTVFVKRSAYKVSDETFIKEDMSVTRSKTTTSGGVNYTDDFIVFQTDEDANNVRVKIEFLTADSVVVATKVFEAAFPIKGNGITQVDFNLNDPDTPIIKNVTVTVK